MHTVLWNRFTQAWKKALHQKKKAFGNSVSLFLSLHKNRKVNKQKSVPNQYVEWAPFGFKTVNSSRLGIGCTKQHGVCSGLHEEMEGFEAAYSHRRFVLRSQKKCQSKYIPLCHIWKIECTLTIPMHLRYFCILFYCDLHSFTVIRSIFWCIFMRSHGVLLKYGFCIPFELHWVCCVFGYGYPWSEKTGVPRWVS